MKIVLGGYIVGYPLGGMTWHHLNYVLGLRTLGHEVTFLEDGAYLPPFDPAANTYGDPAYGLAYLRNTFARYAPDVAWHYRYGDFSDGLSTAELAARLRDADLFIAVSGITPIDWYDLPKRTLVIDTDPVFTQLRMQSDGAFLGYYRRFAHVATFGRLIGTPACPLPTHGLDWIPTHQPIALDAWPVTPPPADGLLTTLGKWEHARDRVVRFDGQTFASDKSSQYERLIDVPRRAGTPIEMRMAGLDDASRERFAAHGWTFADPAEPSAACSTYADWIRNALGEFTAVKQIYSGIPSGWFSDRSAAFLASGRPVIAQDSGFDRWLPTGEGLFSVRDPDEAVTAVRTIQADPPRQSRAARTIAEAHFDARRVLAELIAPLG